MSSAKNNGSYFSADYTMLYVRFSLNCRPCRKFKAPKTIIQHPQLSLRIKIIKLKKLETMGSGTGGPISTRIPR